MPSYLDVTIRVTAGQVRNSKNVVVDMTKLTAPETLVGVAVNDMFTMAAVRYPVSVASLKYDFVFSKGDRWFYVNSANKKSEFDKQKSTIASRNELWLVVEPQTGKVVEHGPKA